MQIIAEHLVENYKDVNIKINYDDGALSDVRIYDGQSEFKSEFVYITKATSLRDSACSRSANLIVIGYPPPDWFQKRKI
jgi:hypothetical protein